MVGERYLFVCSSDVLTQKNNVLCSSGCFVNFHDGHRSYLKAFLELGEFLGIDSVLFLNTSDYVKTKNPSFDTERDTRLLRLKKEFPDLNVQISDDGASTISGAPVIWYCGKEYLKTWFKEKVGVHPSVIGNIFYLEDALGSSRINLETHTIWNLR